MNRMLPITCPTCRYLVEEVSLSQLRPGSNTYDCIGCKSRIVVFRDGYTFVTRIDQTHALRKQLLEEQARREAEKQTLLQQLREHFERRFLTAPDFYRSQCSRHLSLEEYNHEKTAFVRSWVRSHLQSEPDVEQAAAIGAIEGHVQVVARAGSGKTTTLINRALFLQKHCGVAPHEMLLLAFNKKAAEEMRDRFNDKVDGAVPHVMTFHALAYALVHPENILFDEPDGEQSKSRALQSVIDDYLRSDEGYDQLRALMLSHFREDWERIVAGGYDRTPNELLRYRRSLPHDGLDGRRYKSFGEKVIADFLFEHDVNYRYERNFWWNGKNYHPDFTIFTGNDTGVVIEYFGLDGDPDYDKQSDHKREYWRRKPNWKFLEFSPADLRKGVEHLHALLQQSLETCAIPCTRLSEDEIWHRIKDRAIDRFTKIVVGFVQRCRKRLLTTEQLADLVDKHSCTSMVEQQFLELGQIFYKAYLERLKAMGEEDFDGLMQQATAVVASGQTVFRRKSGSGDLKQLRYILIDEYQDFAELFYRLIEAIRSQNPQAQYFCVGDDWQAINGFAGSDLRFYRDFKQLFQPARTLYITTNYRSTSAIVDTGNALMRGLGTPARAHTKAVGTVMVADLKTFESVPSEQEHHPGDVLTPAVLRLVNKALTEGKQVVLLSRKNSLPWFVNHGAQRGKSAGTDLGAFLDLVQEQLPKSERGKVTISTAHKYKGLQKHTVIVLDAVPHCYPLIHPDLRFTRIFGDSVEQTVAEERRLFYVALTRAAERLIILTEQDNFSPFLEDLQGTSCISRLQWSHYPPIARSTKRIVVRIGNQEGRGGSGTFAIRDMLKVEGFDWKSTGWPNWWRTVPADGFSVEQFAAKAVWGKAADGLEVRFFDDFENMVAVYRVTNGRWGCIVDNFLSGHSEVAVDGED